MRILRQTYLFHIAFDTDIDKMKRSGDYHCDSLTSEGFIHCCDQQQLAGVANRYYRDANNVTLMILDPDKLEPALIRENTVGGSELFPHLYGPVNREAIIELVPFGIGSPEREGLFE